MTIKTLTRQDEMQMLISKGGALKKEYLETEAWLLANVTHEDFIAKALRRNWLSVEIDRTRKKMHIITGDLTEQDYTDNVRIQMNREQY